LKLTKTIYKPAPILAAIALILVSCNKNSTSWFNRNYQNTVARYNVYYNGTEKLKEVKLTLALNHKDNYDEVLDVFPYGDEQQAKAQEALMDIVITKGSKIILDRPISKWVDDAYLLVGKGYFFKGDYYAAIETFQYINTRYKNTEIAQEATIWILKSYLMLKRYDDAEALVGLLKNEKKFPDRLKGLFSAASAQVYIKQRKYKPALENMRMALTKTKGRTQKARYTYIYGQLFEKLGQPDSAKFYLKRVLKLNPPYEMAFNAKISLARNYDPADKAQVRTARRYLRSMLRDDKNISFYDRIYYQLGIIEKREGNTTQAIDNFKLSLQNSQNNEIQKALSYLALADIYFNKPDYTLAQLYYDSTARVIKPEFTDYKTILKKQSVLSELIKYKVIVEREDSLQLLASLSPKELDKRVDGWIKDEENRKKRAEEEKEEQNNNPGGGLPGFPNTPGSITQQPSGSGSNWYFYSPQQIGIGYTDFVRKWGNRKLTDDWRYSQKEKELLTTNPDPKKKGDKGDKGDKTEPQTDPQGKTEDDKRLADIPEAKRKYYRDIPFTDQDKARSNQKIAGALYNIGIIYFEKLGDIPEAVNAFEELVNRYPGSEFEPRAYYYLYKIFKDRDASKADEYKKRLVEKYPDSDYAILVNDGIIERNTTITIDWRKTDFYNTTLDLYNKSHYAEVKSRRPVADTMLVGTVLMPKYELLYAMSIGKTESAENYKQQLNKVIEQYPATEISRKANELLDALERLTVKKTDTTSKEPTSLRDTREDKFINKPDGPHYAIIVLPGTNNDVNAIRISLSNFNQSTYPNETLEVISSLLNSEQQLILIRTFDSRDRASDYVKKLENYHAMFIKGIERAQCDYLTITPENYGELLRMKDLAPYKSFYKRYYSK
jgi:tetratricopeptide (TPR) repeat protein